MEHNVWIPTLDAPARQPGQFLNEDDFRCDLALALDIYVMMPEVICSAGFGNRWGEPAFESHPEI